MDKRILTTKGVFAGIGTLISEHLNFIGAALTLLTILMIVDYISGMLAAKREAIDHPDDPCYGWSSKKSIIGIYKKIGYILTILVAICTDYVIIKLLREIGVEYQTNSIFGLLVIVWFIINELLSILENAGRMGVNLPEFLKKVLSSIKENIDEK